MSDISTAIPIDRIRSLIEMHDRKMAAADDASQKIIIIGNDGDIALNILRGIIKALTTRLAPDRDWRCPECRCHTYADISGSPGMIRCVNCKHVSALTPATAPDREAIARVIDDRAFRSWQSMYDYCIKSGDTPETAKVYADGAHGPEIEKALTKADAILSLMGEG